jgi:hypothetical protein
VVSTNLFSQEIEEEYKYIMDTLNNRKIYLTVEKHPKCSIRDDSLLRYIAENNYWPQMDTSCWFHRIYLMFIIEPSGKISNVDVQIVGTIFCDNDQQVEKFRQELKENLTKVMKGLPDWIPGEIRGKPVPVRLMIPIHVSLRF